jgi:excisionase family DNA binding protein
MSARSTTPIPSQSGARRPATPLAPLLDIPSVATVLHVTPRHIRRLVAERRIPYLKVGRFVRFDPAELSVWLDQQRVEAVRPSCIGAHRR